MLTDEDRRRLLESRHDLGASENPDLLTAEKTLKAALGVFRTQLKSTREKLKLAAAAVSKEKSETEAERIKLQEAVASGIGRYGFIRGKVQDALLNIDPDEKVKPAEIERRQKLFNRVFRATASDLARHSQADAIEALGTAADSLSVEPDLKPLEHAKSLAAAHAVAERAAEELNREVDEDSAAMGVLRGTREEFDRAQWAYGLLVESILVREKKEAELGRFLLTSDAAYAARRAAKAPVDQEPGIGEVDTEADEAGAKPKEG